MELVVVLAIFMVVLGTAISIFISIIGHQRRILAEQEFLNQMSYLMEYMSRSIRTSAKDTAGSCMGTPGYFYILTNFDVSTGFYKGIKFLTDDSVCQEFFIGTDGKLKESKNAGAPQIILSDKYSVNHVRFIINGDKNVAFTYSGSGIQPRITMVFSINSQISGDQGAKIFQTSVSQRNLNVP